MNTGNDSIKFSLNEEVVCTTCKCLVGKTQDGVLFEKDSNLRVTLTSVTLVFPRHKCTVPNSYYAVLSKKLNGVSAWYVIWTTQSYPITPRGHEWHVHADYDHTGGTELKPGPNWYFKPSGAFNRDFTTRLEMKTCFLEKVEERIKKGYILDKKRSRIPERQEQQLSFLD